MPVQAASVRVHAVVSAWDGKVLHPNTVLYSVIGIVPQIALGYYRRCKYVTSSYVRVSVHLCVYQYVFVCTEPVPF